MKKIFIADDDDDILEILHMMLQTKGYIIQTTSNANDIFEPTDQLADLIILDLSMSGIDGRDICIRLRESSLTKNIPVIFFSANSQLKEIAEEYEVRDFIEKPFDMKHLLNKIHEILFY